MILVQQFCLFPCEYNMKIRKVNFELFVMLLLGIGAGLESMTINPMAFDGQVNPRVNILNFSSSVKVLWKIFQSQC